MHTNHALVPLRFHFSRSVGVTRSPRATGLNTERKGINQPRQINNRTPISYLLSHLSIFLLVFEIPPRGKSKISATFGNYWPGETTADGTAKRIIEKFNLLSLTKMKSNSVSGHERFTAKQLSALRASGTLFSGASGKLFYQLRLDAL